MSKYSWKEMLVWPVIALVALLLPAIKWVWDLVGRWLGW